jgi:Tol biopolymer transport system component
VSCSRLCGSTLPVVLAVVVMASAAPAGATVPGENGAIAFVSSGDVWVVQPDGSGLRNLTSHPADDWSPDWSPDGRLIAFVSNRGGSDGIYAMNGDGSGLRQIGPGTEPAWSPDGRRLAFVQGDAIWVMNADGSGRRRLTDPASDIRTSPGGERFPGQRDGTPFWSPDGARIAFNRLYGGYDRRLYSIPASGGAPTRIRDLSNEWFDDWSPDGTRLVGTWASVSQGGFMSQSLQVITADGRDRVLLPGLSGALSHPAWSPAGDRLVAAFYAGATPPAMIVTMDVDGSAVTYLPEGTGPDWQALNPYPVGLVDPMTGVWYLRGADAAVTSFYYGDPGDIPMMGDWDGDGIDTPGLFRRSDGYVYLRNSNTQGVADVRFYFGNPGDIPLAGDFDGDGFDTVSLYRPSEGRVYIVNRLGSGDTGLGAADLDYYFGNPGDKPFVGDFDGDGIDTIGLHRESTGLVYFRNDHLQGPAQWSFLLGDPGDRVVAHDWNRDGADSVAVFRPSNAKLYIRFSNTTGVADREYFFGHRDWLPVTGTFGLP